MDAYNGENVQVALERLINKKMGQCHEEIKNLNRRVKELSDKAQSLISRLDGVENTFNTSFTVDGSTQYYYPVAIAVHEQWLTRSPLEYEIYRSYWEKAPDSLSPLGDNDNLRHYPALTLKLLATEGGWGAAGNTIKVLYHQYNYNKTVGKIELGRSQDYRVIVWLRGGGILYHIKSPLDLTGKYRCDSQKVPVDSIKVYYGDNELPCGNYLPVHYPTFHISPLPFGQEDTNLVNQGQYVGWAF